MSEAHRARVIATPWAGAFCVETDSARHFAPHWHGTFGLGVIERGAQRSASGRGVVDAYAGDLITTNPGEVHDGRPLGSPSRRWKIVHLEPEALAAIVGPDPSAGCTSLEIGRPVLTDARIRFSVLALFRALDALASGRGEAAACEEPLAAAWGMLLERHGTCPPADGAARDLRLVLERLGDDPAARTSLAELGSLVGLGRYQLLRQFRRAYGMTPHAWQRQHRCERARRLIVRGAGLAAAAAACGFSDQSHMTRAFGKVFGFTPGDLRARNRVQDAPRTPLQTRPSLEGGQTMIRACGQDDVPAIHDVINDAAQAYKGIIPPDRWHEPYMPMQHLQSEIAAGVRFWGYEDEGELIGVMGIQDRGEVDLIRHAYVRTRRRSAGIGSKLLAHLESRTDKPILIGTWAAATWAIRFYEKNRYRLLSREDTVRLLKKYWSIPERQIETSVVLASPRWAG